MSIKQSMVVWCFHKLGMKECGAFGGYTYRGSDIDNYRQRWCRKPFGHSDSCAFDDLKDLPVSQPGFKLRQYFKGWID